MIRLEHRHRQGARRNLHQDAEKNEVERAQLETDVLSAVWLTGLAFRLVIQPDDQRPVVALDDFDGHCAAMDPR